MDAVQKDAKRTALFIGGLTLAMVVGVLVRSAATRARLRESLAPVWPPFRSRSDSLPLSEISQKTPPAVN